MYKNIKILILLYTIFLLFSCMPNMGAKVIRSTTTTLNSNNLKKEDKKIDAFEAEKQLYISMQASNYREVVYEQMKNNLINNKARINYNTIDKEDSQDGIIKDVNFKKSNLKYRRSSLYTLMVYDSVDKYNFYYRYSFGKAQISHKFNNHNIGPFLISVSDKNFDIEKKIEAYLNENNVAKQLVSRWFNRDENGFFNMDLVAKRGEYNASELDKQIALKSVRGRALLKDAGEELISNTFVVVYDFSTESKGNSALTGLPTICFNLKANLYRLVWNEEMASTFYNDYWVDKNSPTVAKIKAFENSNIFKLKFVGSSLVKSKNVQNLYLVPEVLEKLIDNSMADLQRTYEEFKVKFPLYSGDPIAAKIGKKEGVKEGDKYEVLEQIQNPDGTTKYQKIGEIKVASEKDIWDNTAVGDWFGKTKSDYTIFIGSKEIYFPGMLIRQIN